MRENQAFYKGSWCPLCCGQNRCDQGPPFSEEFLELKYFHSSLRSSHPPFQIRLSAGPGGFLQRCPPSVKSTGGRQSTLVYHSPPDDIALVVKLNSVRKCKQKWKSFRCPIMPLLNCFNNEVLRFSAGRAIPKSESKTGWNEWPTFPTDLGNNFSKTCSKIMYTQTFLVSEKIRVFYHTVAAT